MDCMKWYKFVLVLICFLEVIDNAESITGTASEIYPGNIRHQHRRQKMFEQNYTPDKKTSKLTKNQVYKLLFRHGKNTIQHRLRFM